MMTWLLWVTLIAGAIGLMFLLWGYGVIWVGRHMPPL